ncbi:MAG: dipeptide epimerase [Myxococcales bacterium]
MRVTIERIEVTPLSVPLLEPFVIATGRIDVTRAVLVRATLANAQGARATGLGEAAALPPVTAEDQPDVLAALQDAVPAFVGRAWSTSAELATELETGDLASRPVARAGLECALLDAWARLVGQPLCSFLTGAPPRVLYTDITLPIGEPAHMLELARHHYANGFRVFKVKIGKAIDQDLRALTDIASALGDARFRLDANAAFSADQALWLLERVQRAGIVLECFEQPCARDDLVGMATLSRAASVPVVADESVRTLEDLERIYAAGAAGGVNLKLAKSGGLMAALRIGQRAQELGLRVMCGGMVETRLGMASMGHLACALGGADYVDLDTAFLLASDPFAGGYAERGPELSFAGDPGHGVELR